MEAFKTMSKQNSLDTADTLDPKAKLKNRSKIKKSFQRIIQKLVFAQI